MRKKELLKLLEPFTDDIDILVHDLGAGGMVEAEGEYGVDTKGIGYFVIQPRSGRRRRALRRKGYVPKGLGVLPKEEQQ